MSPPEEPSTPENQPAEAAVQDSAANAQPARRGGLDLSDLKIMPDWVSGMGKPAAAPARHYEEHDRPQRGGPRRHDDRGRGRGPADRGFGGRPQERRPERNEGGFRGQGRDRERGHDRRHRRDSDHRPGGEAPRREWVDLPKDIQASVHPEDKSLDALSAHIKSTGHAFSLFDVARLVLAGGERFAVRFLCDEKRPQPLFSVPADGALFLSRDEAVQHILRSPALEHFYRIEEIELEEPKGNFPSVSVCGFSGELLGPASHHSFQTALIRLHRERFSNMPLEDYKRRIKTDASPEAVQAWKDQQRKAKRWVPLGGDDSEAAAGALSSLHEVELHFRRQHAEQAVAEVRDATVHGNIDKDHLSPALFIMLRQAADATRKHLFEFSQKLSAGFTKRGLKVFKRRSGRMYVCRVRPKVIDPSTIFSERVTAIVQHLKQAPGGMQLHDLLTAMAPPRAEDGAKADQPAPAADSAQSPTPALTEDQVALLKDLRWLANEGYIIEYSDGLVTLGVQGEAPAAAHPEAVQEKHDPAPAEESTAEEAPTVTEVPETVVEQAEALPADTPPACDEAEDTPTTELQDDTAPEQS